MRALKCIIWSKSWCVVDHFNKAAKPLVFINLLSTTIIVLFAIDSEFEVGSLAGVCQRLAF